MAIYKSESFLNNPHTKPSHDIIVENKNSEWIRDYIKWIYGQYWTGQTGITPEDIKQVSLLRLYAEGRQPTKQYKKRWLNQLKEKSVNEYSYIDFENFYSPMPKYIDKLLGMFIGQDHNCIATCTSEFTKEYILEQKAKESTTIKLQYLKQTLNAIVGINPEEDPLANPLFGYALRDLNELELITSSGTVKIPYQIAAEKIIESTQAISNYKHLKREAVRDLALGFISFMEVVDEDKIRWENIDIADVIIDYDKDSHFQNSRYCGKQEWWSVEELRKKGFKEEELKKFANTYHDFNMDRLGITYDKRAFQFYNVKYPATNSYGYDEYLIPVIYGAFKSDDIKYYKDVKTKAGDYRLYPTDFGKYGNDIIKDVKTRIYEGRWIVGTDYVFDDGVMAYIPRNKVTGVKLPIHVAKLKGKCLIERAKQILDEFAMLSYKMQHALARASGKRYTFDFSQLENITKNSGGKLQPFDLIDMWYQGGDMPVRTTPLDDEQGYSKPPPVTEYAGGVGIFLQEMITYKENLIKDLADVTGISPFEMPQSNTSVGLARLAVANMGDVLKPAYDLYLEAKERLSYNTVYRCQLLIHYNKDAENYYRNVIGSEYMNLLKIMNEKEPLEIGVTFEALPSEEMKNHILAWADRATQGGKNGVPILSGSEYLYIVSKINTHSGIKEAMMMLKHREKQDQIEANQRQRIAIESQAQANKEIAEMKGYMDANKAQVQGREKLKQIQLDKDLELRNKGAIKETEMQENMFNKGFDIEQQQQQMDIENKTQQQTI